ncbi:FAD-dependent oxidoreductase, partial [Rhodococcus hoagii]|nr:FAD-dependent oxidoreductase [Prescottella equi]
MRNKGFDGAITLVGDEADLPYDRPPLSKSALRRASPPRPWRSTPSPGTPDNGIDLRLGEACVAPRPARGSATTTLSEIEFDDLVIATGARPRNPFRWLPTASHPAHAHRRPPPAGATALVPPPGRHRWRVHRARGRGIGARIGCRRHGRRGRRDPPLPESRRLVAPILGDLARDHGSVSSADGPWQT